jgi:hypothetical protein
MAISSICTPVGACAAMYSAALRLSEGRLRLPTIRAMQVMAYPFV